MLRNVFLALLTLGFLALAGNPQSIGAPHPTFAPGQQWSIKSASQTTAKVIVGRIEPWRDGFCVSVSIVDIPIPPGLPGAGGVTEIAHAPFDQAALAASVDRLVATGVSPSPSFGRGYQQWRDANGGIFTVSVEKAIGIVLETVRNGKADGRQQGTQP